ncbi:MAG: hypothetical protein J6W28_02545 [Clostridia bacterium]|nr:hypothetical protein [Clostridia bacterium]MBO7170037.1 hypothetical protein [Clostridia bacterium]
MKKTFSKLLVLVLALSLSIGSMAVWGANVTFEAEGRLVQTVEAVGGEVTLPAAPTVMEGQFVGWSGTLNGEKFLLPPGAVLTGVMADLTVTAETFYFVTNTNASVRIKDGDLGLRFTSVLSTEDYDRLIALVGADRLSLGTYIMPDHYLKVSGHKFDLAHMAQFGVEKYLDIPAKKFFATDTENKTATIAGSICQLLEKNRSLDFCGCGYMKLTYTNGETKTFYADFVYAETKHNLAEVVFKAYNDRKESYPNLIPYIQGTIEHATFSTHSPYTVEQLDLMKALMNTIVYVNYLLKEPHYEYINEPSAYYVSPWLISENHDSTRGENTVIITPSAGHTIEELKAVCLASRYRSMRHDASYVNGTFRFVEREWTSVTPK